MISVISINNLRAFSKQFKIDSYEMSEQGLWDKMLTVDNGRFSCILHRHIQRGGDNCDVCNLNSKNAQNFKK